MLASLIEENVTSEPDIVRTIKQGVQKDFDKLVNIKQDIYEKLKMDLYLSIKQEIGSRPEPEESDYYDPADW
jgi:hypothetical protein